MTRELGFDSWCGAEIFLIGIVLGQALVPTQPYVQLQGFFPPEYRGWSVVLTPYLLLVKFQKAWTHATTHTSQPIVGCSFTSLFSAYATDFLSVLSYYRGN